MYKILPRLLFLWVLLSLNACGGGGSSGGGNNAASLIDARTAYTVNAHGAGVKESYTLAFNSADKSVANNFTLYIWGANDTQALGTNIQLQIDIYPDGGTAESCVPTWSANKMASCQFTASSNATNLNLDITNNSTVDATYSYIFLPSTSIGDGGISAPYVIPATVISDTNAATFGGVGNSTGASSYYTFNTGTNNTFDISPLIALNATPADLTVSLYSDIGFTTLVNTCVLNACTSFSGLTTGTDYYLKVSSNGTTASDFIIYQLDLYPSNAAPPIDYGINVSFGYGSWATGYTYSAYLFDSNGVAVAGVWGNSGTFSSAGANIKLKTLDMNGCITTTDAPQITSGIYTLVSTVRDTSVLAYVKPSTCAGTGFIINAPNGQSLTVDMSAYTGGAPIAANADSTAYLTMDVNTGTSATNLYCDVYDGNSSSANDEKYRLAHFVSPMTAGAVSLTGIADYLPLGGYYSLQCIADNTGDGIRNTGDSVFSLKFSMPPNGISYYYINATNTAAWTTVP